MSDVKLSRRALEAALARYDDLFARAVRGVSDVELGYLDRAKSELFPLAVVAARALLAALEPASDEEISDYVRTLQDFEKLSTQAWRAAEARARRLANWQGDE